MVPMPGQPLNNNSSMDENSPRPPDPAQAKKGSQHWLCPGVCSQCFSIWGFSSQLVNNPPASAGDTRDIDLIPGLGRSPGEGNGYPLQYPCLENSMDRGAWVGYSPWGHKELDMTECTYTYLHVTGARGTPRCWPQPPLPSPPPIAARNAVVTNSKAETNLIKCLLWTRSCVEN